MRHYSISLILNVWIRVMSKYQQTNYLPDANNTDIKDIPDNLELNTNIILRRHQQQYFLKLHQYQVF